MMTALRAGAGARPLGVWAWRQRAGAPSLLNPPWGHPTHPPTHPPHRTHPHPPGCCGQLWQALAPQQLQRGAGANLQQTRAVDGADDVIQVILLGLVINKGSKEGGGGGGE